MKRTLLSGVAASVLLLTACGGGGALGLGGDDEKAKSSISDYLMDQQRQEQVVSLDRGQADCIAEDIVDGIGEERLQEYGLLTEDNEVNQPDTAPEMSREDAEVMADAMFECADVMGTIEQQLEQSMVGQSAQTRSCIRETLTEDAVRQVLVATFSGNQGRASQELMGPLMECAAGDLPTPQDQ